MIPTKVINMITHGDKVICVLEVLVSEEGVVEKLGTELCTDVDTIVVTIS
jgi:hypothetical protein